MTLEEYNEFCGSLAHANHVVQWRGAHVWKVDIKVFAIGGWNQGEILGITFKCSPHSYEILSEMTGLRPAPYLASRGMKWVQRYSDETLDDAGLREYLGESHRLAALTLTKKRQRELGLIT